MRAPKSPLGDKLTPVGILLTLITLDLRLPSNRPTVARGRMAYSLLLDKAVDKSGGEEGKRSYL